MDNSTVSLIRCSDYDSLKIAQGIRKQFEHFGGLEKFVKHGDIVLLKPNFIAPRSHRHATQTHPAIIIEIAKLLKDIGARPFVGDSPAWGNIYSCVKALKLDVILAELDIPVVKFDRPIKCQVGNTKIGISSVALDADVIINLPKFKSHQQLVATFAVKNMFGCVSGKRKALLHLTKGSNPDDFCEMLIGIFRLLNPVITIIDGIMAMDGLGPIRGRTRPLGYLICSTDPIACETVCCKMVNIRPEELPIIKAAKRLGFGCSDFEKIKIVGDGFPAEPFDNFEIPRLVPLRFSPMHVCKSVGKQILLLTKYAIKPKADNR